MADESHVPSDGVQNESSSEQKLPVLCREAILPRERGRGMAGVAIVCSMAGVASGLALAATLMAVQIADRPHHQRSACGRYAQVIAESPIGWLGVEFVARTDGAHIRRVFSGTAAESVGLQDGDIIRAVNGEVIDHPSELQYLIRSAGAGSQPELIVERDGREMMVTPMLTSLPMVIRR
jgi:S1-C subfamily serine protease